MDWGTESREIAKALGVRYVYSFHMTLQFQMRQSYSRDPFCCFTTSVDLATFFGCHVRAFAHFGGVSGTIVYDRTKTMVRRHVAPGQAVPIHPEAAAFAEHHGFAVDVLAAHQPQSKGRVERRVRTGTVRGPRRFMPPSRYRVGDRFAAGTRLLAGATILSRHERVKSALRRAVCTDR